MKSALVKLVLAKIAPAKSELVKTALVRLLSVKSVSLASQSAMTIPESFNSLKFDKFIWQPVNFKFSTAWALVQSKPITLHSMKLISIKRESNGLTALI